MYLHKLFTPILFLASLLLITTGCDLANTSKDGPKDVAVTMQIQTSATAQAKFKTQTVDSLTEIKFVVEELELESATEDSLDFEVENLIVNLPLDGSSIQLISQAIPAGFYDEFELEIEHDDDDDLLFDDPDFYEGDKRFSIVVKGIHNGEEFIFKSEKEYELEMDLNPPLEISETSGNASVAINIDPSSWFIDAQGNALNPSDSTNKYQIESNIWKSFKAESNHDDDDSEFEDEDSDDFNDENDDNSSGDDDSSDENDDGDDNTDDNSDGDDDSADDDSSDDDSSDVNNDGDDSSDDNTDGDDDSTDDDSSDDDSSDVNNDGDDNSDDNSDGDDDSTDDDSSDDDNDNDEDDTDTDTIDDNDDDD